jgi:mono/diheme cytochrome c family protein
MTNRLILATAMSVSLLVLLGAAHSQDDDLFAFIPDGGRTLLAQLIEAGLPETIQQDVAAGGKTGAEWLTYLDGQAPTVGALGQFDELQRRTLADYLAYNTPIEAVAQADPSTLPPDGRDLTLEYCQSCHIITVVITQDRAREAWLGTMNKPSHIEIDLTPKQREALADYLVVNAGIPIEDVPPALRAGGASY